MKIDFAAIVEEVVFKFTENHTGPKPRVFAKIPPDLPLVLGEDDGPERFSRYFLYEVLLRSNPETPVQIMVYRRARLKDLEDFVGLSPLYWIQLRVQAYGGGMIESTVEEVFQNAGYRCEEWVGVKGSSAGLAIFCPLEKDEPKMVFCVDTVKGVCKSDFLIPVSDPSLVLPFPSFQTKD